MTSSFFVPCGRATRSGAPCRTTVPANRPVCHTHLTDIDRQWLKVVDDIRDGYREPMERLRQLELSTRRKAQAITEPARRMEQDGAQIVSVAFGSGGTEYAYRWAGRGHLVVGDRVVTPPAYWDGPGAPCREGRVVRLGTSYDGPLVSISRRAGR